MFQTLSKTMTRNGKPEITYRFPDRDEPNTDQN